VFGYIRPQKSELLVREYEQYKGVYCSLCRQLGKSYGVASRLTLSYDCTFYALMLFAFSPECPGFQSGRCVVNPLKKCTYCNTGVVELTTASALSVIMTYHKVKDDIADSHFLGKLRGYMVLPFAAHARKKAARDFPQIDSIVSTAMVEQQAVEHGEHSSIDSSAEPTAKMLQRVFETIDDMNQDNQSSKRRILSQFGYFLGRWVYLIDAADDIVKDIKSKSFNPFIVKYDLNESSTAKELEGVRAYTNQALNSTLSQLVSALNILDLQHFNSIIENVILKGLPEIQKELLFEKEKMNVGSL